ncbi:hypothetical protein, partial [Streptomyces albidoflavus]|uniref:hypothetical protein n=1 Tax=Streptomyces albidoflavus TaxID=1886 RepID=UPI004055B4B4
PTTTSPPRNPRSQPKSEVSTEPGAVHFLLCVWNAFFCLEVFGILVVVWVLRGGGLIGYLFREHLHWLVAVSAVGWLGMPCSSGRGTGWRLGGILC